jgi:hypothetical protein
MKIFEIEPDHVIEIYQLGETSKYQAFSKSASVKLLQLKPKNDKTSMDVLFLRGTTPIFLKTLILNDKFKNLHEKFFNGFQIKYHVNFKMHVFVEIQHPSNMSVKRARLMPDLNFRRMEADNAFAAVTE